MAKRRKARKSAKKAVAAAAGTTVASPTFANRKYRCYGKRVRTGRGKGKSPRVFCGKVK